MSLAWFCARVPQGEGTFLYIAPYVALLVPCIEAQPSFTNESFTSRGPVIIIGSTTRGSNLVRLCEASYLRGKARISVVVASQLRSHRAFRAIPISIFVAHALMFARRHRKEQLLYVAIVSVVGSFLPRSTAIASWVSDGEMTLRFCMTVPSEGCCLTC
jgi:hypothetical protein